MEMSVLKRAPKSTNSPATSLRLIVALFLLTLFPPLSPVTAPASAQGFGGAQEEKSDNVCLFAVPRAMLTLPEFSMDKAKEAVLGTLEALPGKVDTLTGALAEKLETSKKTPSVATISGSEETQVLGASAYNAGVDIFAFLLRHWMATLAGLSVLAITWSFKT